MSAQRRPATAVFPSASWARRCATACLAALLAATTPGAAAAAGTDLLTVLQAAEQMDPTYREAQQKALATAEEVPQARAAMWLPRLSFRGSATRVRQDIVLEGGFGTGGKSSFTNSDYRISLEQPIYNHDRWVALKQADHRVQQAQAEVLAAHQDLLLRVAERYFEVLAAQDNLAFAKAEKQSLQSQLDQAKQRFDVGLIAITDVQEAQAGYDRALASEISAQNEIENTIEDLRETTGAYHDALARLGESVPLATPEPPEIDAWTGRALDNNLNLRAALIATEVTQREIQRRYAGHLPSLNLLGNHGFNRQGGRFGGAEITQSDVSLQLSVPIFEGGTVLSQTRQAEHEHHAALERLEQTRRSVQRETRKAYLGVISEISSVNALSQAVISSRTALESTQAGFEVGTRTAIDVVAAERGLSQAKRDYARARYDYILQTLRLKNAAGSLSPEDLAAANTWLTDAEPVAQ